VLTLDSRLDFVRVYMATIFKIIPHNCLHAFAQVTTAAASQLSDHLWPVMTPALTCAAWPVCCVTTKQATTHCASLCAENGTPQSAAQR